MKKKCNKKKLKTSCFLTKFLYTNEISKIGIKNIFWGAYPADIVPESTLDWYLVNKKNVFFLIVLLNPFLFIHENIGKI